MWGSLVSKAFHKEKHPIEQGRFWQFLVSISQCYKRSLPLQFSSIKLEGISIAAGLMAGLLSSQSAGGSKPSPSLSVTTFDEVSLTSSSTHLPSSSTRKPSLHSTSLKSIFTQVPLSFRRYPPRQDISVAVGVALGRGVEVAVGVPVGVAVGVFVGDVELSARLLFSSVKNEL